MTMCSCDGPPHRYDPSWCINGPVGRFAENRSPRDTRDTRRGVDTRSPCDQEWDPPVTRRNIGRLSAEEAIKRALSHDVNGWPERLANDCRDGGCSGCQRYADRKTAQIIQALLDAGFHL